MRSDLPNSRLVLDRDRVGALVERLRDEILAEVGASSPEIVLVGIRRGGVPLARALARAIAEATGEAVPVGTLDINLYRDDVAMARAVPLVGPSEIPTTLQGRPVVLVDDVLHTGRTVRAAIDALHDYGRPARIWLAVLCDRGGRELPVAADFVGERIEAPSDGKLEVEYDDDGPTGARLTWPPETT